MEYQIFHQAELQAILSDRTGPVLQHAAGDEVSTRADASHLPS